MTQALASGGPVSGKKFVVGCAIGVLLAGGSVLTGAGYWFFHGFRAQPRNVFRANFEGPAARARELRGGGTAWQGHDVWIRFRGADIDPRGFAAFEPFDCREAQQVFRTILEEDHAFLDDSASLECWRSADRSKGYSNGKWLVRNRAGDVTFFRSWSHR